MPSANQHRRSARVILRDGVGCILLIRFAVIRDGAPFVFWATPGGEIENDETELETAKRELLEELRLDIPLAGPVHYARSTFEHDGTLVENTDIFFVGACDHEAPRLDALTIEERDAMISMAGWSVDEIEHTTEVVFPCDLGSILKNLRPEAPTSAPRLTPR